MIYESTHAIKKKSKGGLHAVKLDMHKTYDRVKWSFFEPTVEWSFLEGIMLKMRFVQRWVKIIMVCVSDW
jgi:hypothetical protein